MNSVFGRNGWALTNHCLGSAQELCGLLLKSEMNPESAIAGGCQITALFAAVLQVLA